MRWMNEVRVVKQLAKLHYYQGKQWTDCQKYLVKLGYDAPHVSNLRRYYQHYPEWKEYWENHEGKAGSGESTPGATGGSGPEQIDAQTLPAGLEGECAPQDEHDPHEETVDDAVEGCPTCEYPVEFLPSCPWCSGSSQTCWWCESTYDVSPDADGKPRCRSCRTVTGGAQAHQALIGASSPSQAPVTSSDPEIQSELTRLQRARVKLEKEKLEAVSILDLAKRERADLASRQANIDEQVAALLAPPPIFKPAPIIRVTSDHDVIVDLSDIHFGKYVEDRQLGPGFNYNKAIAAERIKQIEAELAEIARTVGASQGLRYLFIFGLGDIIDGSTMRTGQAWRIDMTVNEQKYYACQVLTDFIFNCEKMGFLKVIFRYVVGNHGRLRNRLDDDKLVDNHEFNLAQMIKATFEHTAHNVFVTPVERYYDFVQIGEKTHSLQHGHFIKGSGGALPIVGVEKYLARQAKDVFLRTPDYSHVAHFHQSGIFNWGHNREIILNGAGDDSDDFVCNTLGKASSAAQWIHLSHPTDGIYDHRSVRFKNARAPLIASVLA